MKMISVNITKNLVIMTMVIITAALTSCAGKGPEDAFIMERLGELIEKSYEINDIFFGEGLPYHDRESDFAIENRLYDEAHLLGEYDLAVFDERFLTVADIKTAAELVYTSDYLASIYITTFTGYLEPNIGMVYSRYMDSQNGLLVNREYASKLRGRREYNLSSAEIVLKNDKYTVIEIETNLPGIEEEYTKVSLTIKNQDGVWLLDNPTY